MVERTPALDGAPVRRSDRTRAAILAAARERFAADGYERATIRAIAADAAIDPAMVMRYFSSKEKLFAAAAVFDLRLPTLDAVPQREIGELLTRHFVERWEGDETLMALLRAAVTNQGARERMLEIFGSQLEPAVASLVDAAQAAPRAALVATQMLGIALCRYVLQLPSIATMTTDELVAWTAPAVQRYLTAPKP